MQRTVRAAAIYSRISSDQDGAALGVTRQEQDCRELADRLGWPVAEVYRDNDISAYSGKRRPAYQRMLEDIEAGRRDAVVVYHADRLTRRPKELEEFVEVLDRAKATLKFVAGDTDITNGDGLMMLRVQAAFAAHESQAKSRRIERKGRERAEKGLPTMGGTNRPFGYEDDRVTIRPAEAAVIRELVARFLAGESFRSLTQWLQDNDIRTPRDLPWGSSRVRTMMLSPRIAGLREYHGAVIGDAVWPAIISSEDRDRMLALVEQRKATKARTPRRHLLSGLLRCDRCGGKLYATERSPGRGRPIRRTYACMAGPDHGGCGAMSITAGPVEELVTAAVLLRLSGPDLAHAMAGRAADDTHAAALAQRIEEDQSQLVELTAMFANREITAAEWRRARDIIHARVKDNSRQLAQLTHTDALSSIDPADPELAATFAALPLTRQHAIIAAVLDHARVLPGKAGAHRVDPARVQPVWRV